MRDCQHRCSLGTLAAGVISVCCQHTARYSKHHDGSKHTINARKLVKATLRCALKWLLKRSFRKAGADGLRTWLQATLGGPEVEQVRVQGAVRLLMDCVADIVEHEGLDVLPAMSEVLTPTPTLTLVLTLTLPSPQS